ncbi:hypothetical protein BCR36DRAFT_361191 [Piromyces finnis]|uniref:RGS domain-containing protein n=1 Tax=Piromyces finnis TaxID=1754191 RepID=A0A1Y1UZZ7_9FUNG|nr:hypothetical protein BCR36DRAFT_361191 [Piromyces finnis]|eukprot:ORX43440.1 hypothetical protein BCR36DRAFT_361191 [Piromyces finnis]
MILQININSKSSGQRRMLLDFYEVTKGGKLLFTIVAIYILFTSITLPLIKYYLAKRNKVRNSDDITKSKDYFKKVLNTPSLVFILRNIAIKEFSVENVLFWENYQILQNMNYRFYNESKKVKETDDDGYIRLTNDYDYDYDGYYQQQIQSIAVDPMNNYSYVPDTPVPKEILPYYQNFFKTFIHRNGKAAVNIPDSIAKVIQGEMTFPTIGIFDSAKEEVIEMMYNSIYPIFLQNYKSQLDETFA